MGLCIERIEEVGPDRRARLLVFDTTETLRTAATVVKALALEEGSKVISLRDLREQVDKVELEQARERCLRILNARDKTSHELLARLKQDGYSVGNAELVVERFIEVGLVDNARYVELYLSSAQAAKKGWHRIKRELEKKGIDTEELEPPDAEVELEQAQAVIACLPVSSHKEKERVLRRLMTKGYSYTTALKAIEIREAEEEKQLQ